MGKRRSALTDCLICALLIAAALIVYWQVAGFDFTSYDDEDYVTRNPMVREGLTVRGIARAFTTMHAANWHPLTWLSHMLDCTIFGVNPGAHHAVNLFIHIVNTLLLFIVLKRMTGFAWRSGFVAALFAIHPLHVESVAWIAERKDVLSGLFFMLTILLYTAYARRPSIGRYLLVFIAFALGLMAKPMLVTLPIVLLLLDFWPLRRWQAPANTRPPTPGVLIIEKLPLFFLAAISSLLTCLAQHGAGAMGSLMKLPVSIRFDNALVSYVQYVIKMFWPAKLAAIYPHPGNQIPTWQIPAAGAALVAMTVFFLALRRQRPWLTVGWLWFLVTLTPVIGIVQVGSQSMADRYTYIPLIGLFMVIAWEAGELVARRPITSRALAVPAVLVILVLMVCAWLQVGHWRNSITLFSHAVACTKDNEIAQNNLGTALAKIGKYKEAAAHFAEVLRINPQSAGAHVNIGADEMLHGRTNEALRHFQLALKINPNNEQAHYDIGKLFAQQGKLKQAEYHIRKALARDPNLAEAQIGLGNVLCTRGRLDEAITHYVMALRLDPDNAPANFNLGRAYGVKRDFKKAITYLKAALKISPRNSDAHFFLAIALEEHGNVPEALAHYRSSLRIRPDRTDAANNLAWILATTPDPHLRNPNESIMIAERICKATNNINPLLLDTLAAAYASAGRFDKAIGTARKAVKLAGKSPSAKDMEARLQLYRSGRTFIQR